MKGVLLGSSLEAVCLSLKTRKFYPQPPYRHETLGKIVYPFKLGVRSEATIDESYPSGHVFFDQHSARNEGDQLVGETLSGFSSKSIRPEVDHGSGTHKATFAKAKAGSYAKIDIPVREIIESKRLGRDERKQLKHSD